MYRTSPCCTRCPRRPRTSFFHATKSTQTTTQPRTPRCPRTTARCRTRPAACPCRARVTSCIACAPCHQRLLPLQRQRLHLPTDAVSVTAFKAPRLFQAAPKPPSAQLSEVSTPRTAADGISLDAPANENPEVVAAATESTGICHTPRAMQLHSATVPVVDVDDIAPGDDFDAVTIVRKTRGAHQRHAMTDPEQQRANASASQRRRERRETRKEGTRCRQVDSKNETEPQEYEERRSEAHQR